MPNPVVLREPELSPAARRVLAALLFSLGLHAGIIGLIQLAPVSVATKPPAVMQVQLPQPAVFAKPISPNQLQAHTPVMTTTIKSDLSVKTPQPVKAVVIPPSAEPARPASVVNKHEESLQDVPGALPAAKSDLPVIDVPIMVDNTYYTAKEVDVHPHALQAVLPVYPQAANDGNIEGWVLLKIKLDVTGKVEDVKVSDANPAGVFDQSALDAFAKASFAPAQKAGRAVKSLVEIKVWFNLN